MATLEGLRNSILTSIKGRRLGLTQGEFLVGAKDLAKAKQTIGSSTNSSASSTGTEILNYGLTSLSVATECATTGSSYGTTETGGKFILAAPEPGVEKIIYTASQHSTHQIAVFCSTGVTILNTSLGSSFGGVSFNAPNQWVRLFGVSTAKWLLGGLATGTSIASS